MKIVFGEEIAKSIKSCSPKYVVVAYVGKDWKNFIPDVQNLQTVILSPTLGSNPHAISEMVSVLGWDKIEFLDELHAKLYFGENSAIVGSSNLTMNGLSGEALHELCTVITNRKHLDELESFFDETKIKAMRAYPSKKAKQQKLNSLYTIWGQAVSYKIIQQPQTYVKLKDFELLSDNQFYVCWYQQTNEEFKYSSDLKDIEKLVEDEMHLLPKDNIQKGKWILAWAKTSQNTVSKRVKPNWIYIHEVFKDAVDEPDYEYTKVAIERNDLKKPVEPFALTAEVIDALRVALENDENKKYFIQPNKEYEVNYSQQHLGKLIKDMQNIVETVG